jgi:hypothetical protein
VNRRTLPSLLVLSLLLSACASGSEGGFFEGRTEPAPLCTGSSESLILLAQTVQDSTRLPCITGYPAGWSYGGDDFRRGSATYWLSSAIAGSGSRPVEVQLLPSCERIGERFTVQGTTGVDGYVTTDTAGETRRFLFDGGCIVERISLPSGTDELVLEQARGTLGFFGREVLAFQLQEDHGVTLCGAGAEPCVG